MKSLVELNRLLLQFFFMSPGVMRDENWGLANLFFKYHCFFETMPYTAQKMKYSSKDFFSKSEYFLNLLPLYNSPSVVFRLRPFVHLRAILLACKTDAMEKPKKTSFKIYKHLVQQYVQQVVHNLRDVFFLIDLFRFKKIVKPSL